MPLGACGTYHEGSILSTKLLKSHKPHVVCVCVSISLIDSATVGIPKAYCCLCDRRTELTVKVNSRNSADGSNAKTTKSLSTKSLQKKF